MQAKLEAAIAALRGGVAEVRISPGAAPHVLTQILAGQPLGTTMLLEEVPVS
jgi:acetylglutamate kinase